MFGVILQSFRLWREPPGLIREPDGHLGLVLLGVRVGGERNRDSHASEIPTPWPCAKLWVRASASAYRRALGFQQMAPSPVLLDSSGCCSLLPSPPANPDPDSRE